MTKAETFIYHTFLAGWCADAAGARLEFRKQRFTQKQAIDAMHFVGEKSTGIPEGQFTDDSEMELCLLQALIDGKGEEEFPVEKIADEYIKWFASKPFDIGLTTSNALLESTNAHDMVNNAFTRNENSESNGSLMRCIPIAVFCTNKSDEITIRVAAIDASLTHYSEEVQLITGIYCCVISKILSQRIRDPEKPIDIGELIHFIRRMLSMSRILIWAEEALELSDLCTYDCIKNEGHIKHAFTFFVFFLKHIDAFTYENAMIEIFQCGGDTDTNGKIVGNLFGAYYGDCVPKYMRDPVLNFDCTTAPDYFRRPANYDVKRGIELISKINILSDRTRHCRNQ
jgi:ADP-ribosyl-[dinitrogen reductase] hydrolase